MSSACRPHGSRHRITCSCRMAQSPMPSPRPRPSGSSRQPMGEPLYSRPMGLSFQNWSPFRIRCQTAPRRHAARPPKKTTSSLIFRVNGISYSNAVTLLAGEALRQTCDPLFLSNQSRRHRWNWMNQRFARIGAIRPSAGGTRHRSLMEAQDLDAQLESR